MKTVAYTALHYGRDYLGWAIRSVIDHIDEYHVLYSPEGSHGHKAAVRCPETRGELFSIAAQAAGDKLRWHNGDWRYENQQRESIYQFAPDADVILVLDADEIWSEKLINRVITYSGSIVYSSPQRFLRLPIIHYWRSFYRCVLHDPAYPVRVIFPRIDAKYGEGSWSIYSGHINHMGYAQRSEIVAYKLLTHGHRNEFRRDIDWFRERWQVNAQQDCHPVGSEWWNPELVDPLAFMPSFMAGHPYFNLEVIP